MRIFTNISEYGDQKLTPEIAAVGERSSLTKGKLSLTVTDAIHLRDQLTELLREEYERGHVS